MAEDCWLCPFTRLCKCPRDVTYIACITLLTLELIRNKMFLKVKVKNDHRSKFSNLSDWKEEPWKNQGFNGIRTRDLSVTGALLHQLSYEATHWERGQFIEFISPMRSEMMWSIYEIIHSVTSARRSRVRIPLKPWLFQASSFQSLKLENLLRWSFFSFIYNRSSKMNYFIYTSHQNVFRR